MAPNAVSISCRGVQSRLEPCFLFCAILGACDEEGICLMVFVPLQTGLG